MEIRIVTLGARTARKHASAEEMFAGYCERIGHHCRCARENFATEEKFFAALERGGKRTLAAKGATRMGHPPKAGNPMAGLVLLDGRGRELSSEQLADWLRRERDGGVQRLVFAVGPADGWSEAARGRAALVLSLGPMTLPHELAAVVLAEQIYRAFTILEGHPYHLGHC